MSSVQYRSTRFTAAIGLVLALLLSFGVISVAEPAEAAQAGTTVRIASFKSVNASKVTAGELAAISGKVSPNLKSKTLKLQVYKNGRWLDLGITTKATTSATFKITFRPTAPGVVKYRVVFAGSSTLKSSYDTTSATVWKWYTFETQKIVASDGTSWSSDPEILTGNFGLGSSTYKNALTTYYSRSSGSGGWVEYNLAYKCSAVRMTYGINNNSSSDAVMRFTTNAGGNIPSAGGDMSLGNSKKVQFATQGQFRFRLTYHVLNGTGWPLWVNGAMLCTSSPNSK